MTLKFSANIKNERLNAIEVGAVGGGGGIGTAALLRLYSGAVPTDADAALSGNTLLCEMTLPSDWLANAASGSKAKSGTWSDVGKAAANTGTTATFFRVYNSAGTACGIQGSVGASAADLILDNPSIASGQTVTINSFSLTDGN